MKQIKRLLLLLIMTSFVIIESKAYDFELDSLRYTIMDNNSVYVSGYNHNLDGVGGIIWSIPSSVYHNGVSYTVTGISNSAFSNFIRLWDITIPNTVTEIGDKAFQNCTNLQYVWCQTNTPPTIYSSTFNNIHSKCVLYVRKHLTQAYLNANYWSAFGNRIEEVPDIKINNIYYYIIDDNTLEVSSFGENSYSGNVTIPARVTVNGKSYQVTKIGTDAFYYCDNLVSINMPNTIKSIDRHAFYGCSKLKSITIPESVTSIDDEAFAYMTLNHINFNAISCDDFIKHNYSSIDPQAEIIFGDKVQRIPAWFWGGKNSNLIIPNSVTSIGDGAFYCWPNLTEVTIPEKVDSIGYEAFINSNIKIINSLNKKAPIIEWNTFNGSTLSYAKVNVPMKTQLNYLQKPFWNNFLFIIQPEFISGDVNNDGEVNISDINQTIDIILSSNEEFNYSADVNNDGEVNIADINMTIQQILCEDNHPNENQNVCQFNIRGVSFKMIKVEGGTFEMGISGNNNVPIHQVTLSDYYIGETEVTQELYKAVMGYEPPNRRRDYSPLVPVQLYWSEYYEFIGKLNQITGKNFRLPTEAEWEYAARGGKLTHGYRFAGCNSLSELSNYAWWGSAGPINVAEKLPNELGLYDMSGNLNEFCLDYYGKFTSDPQTNPCGPPRNISDPDLPPFNAHSHVARGGSYTASFPWESATGLNVTSDNRYYGYEDGFRLAF